MKKLKPSRSHGLDFIDSYSLQLAFPLLEDSILHLVNLSISSRTYSKNWKFQLVLPLHKKNDPMDGTNFRPVSHIIEIGKIVEYVVHDQVYSHQNCLLKCEDCINLSQCKACRIIQEIEERHENIFEDDYKMHEGRQDMKTDMRVSWHIDWRFGSSGHQTGCTSVSMLEGFHLQYLSPSRGIVSNYFSVCKVF